MRVAIPLLGLLLLVGWGACTFPGSIDRGTEQLGESFSWRRTTDGWEVPQWWSAGLEREPPVPHPVVIGLLQVLIAATIGVASLPHTSVAGPSSAKSRKTHVPLRSRAQAAKEDS